MGSRGGVIDKCVRASLQAKPNLADLYYRPVKYYSPQTGICIIRVARDQHKVAWAGVTLLSNIEGHIFVPNVVHLSGASIRFASKLHVVVFASCCHRRSELFDLNLTFWSGTIRQAQLAAIQHNREVVARYRTQAGLPGAWS